jgi:hypothetical protein
VVGFGLLGYGLAYAGQLVLALAGIVHLPDDLSSVLGLIIGGAAAALQKAWNIAERAAAVGVEIPTQPGVSNVPSPTASDNSGEPTQ